MRQFPGYTLASIRDEDTELLRLLAIEKAGHREQPDQPELEV